MRRLLILSVALRWGSRCRPAAEPIDLSTVTCKKFFEYNKDNLSLLLMWLDGYYKDEDDDPIIDFDKMARTPRSSASTAARTRPTASSPRLKTLLK